MRYTRRRCSGRGDGPEFEVLLDLATGSPHEPDSAAMVWLEFGPGRGETLIYAALLHGCYRIDGGYPCLPDSCGGRHAPAMVSEIRMELFPRYQLVRWIAPSAMSWFGRKDFMARLDPGSWDALADMMRGQLSGHQAPYSTEMS